MTKAESRCRGSVHPSHHLRRRSRQHETRRQPPQPTVTPDVNVNHRFHCRGALQPALTRRNCRCVSHPPPRKALQHTVRNHQPRMLGWFGPPRLGGRGARACPCRRGDLVSRSPSFPSPPAGRGLCRRKRRPEQSLVTLLRTRLRSAGFLPCEGRKNSPQNRAFEEKHGPLRWINQATLDKTVPRPYPRGGGGVCWGSACVVAVEVSLSEEEGEPVTLSTVEDDDRRCTRRHRVRNGIIRAPPSRRWRLPSQPSMQAHSLDEGSAGSRQRPAGGSDHPNPNWSDRAPPPIVVEGVAA